MPLPLPEHQHAPISRVFGFDRGTPIDRYYINAFLGQYSRYIKGRVMEVADNTYTKQFGTNRVTKSEILHVDENTPGATLTGDIESGRGIPNSSFDCIILTQVLNVIYEIKSAVRHLYAALSPGGILLATMPGISQISRYDMDRWGDYWRFTTRSAKRLFEEAFPPAGIIVTAFGSVYTSSAFLYGLSAEELSAEDLDRYDQDYELLIGVCAQKI